MEDDQGWTLVTARKPRCPLPFPPTPSPPCLTSTLEPKKKRFSYRSLSSPAQTQDVASLLSQLKRSMQRVERSDFYKKFLAQLQSCEVWGNLCTTAGVSRRLENPDPAGPCWELAGRGDGATTGVREADGLALDVQRGQERPGSEIVEQRADVFNGHEDDAGKICQEREIATCFLEEFADSMATALRETGWKRESVSERQVLVMKEKGCHYDDLACRETCGSGDGRRETNFGSAEGGEGRLQLQIIVYGLGSIADSEVSRCQLSLVLLLKQSFSWVRGIEVYDPVLSDCECKVILEMGCSLIAINEEGNRSIDSPTVFYMPHCEDWLYDNVLRANWSLHKLNQLIILGNSFTSYQQRWSSFPGSRSKPPPTFVLQLQKHAVEIPFEATSAFHVPAFTNMSWHFFMVKSVPGSNDL